MSLTVESMTAAETKKKQRAASSRMQLILKWRTRGYEQRDAHLRTDKEEFRTMLVREYHYTKIINNFASSFFVAAAALVVVAHFAQTFRVHVKMCGGYFVLMLVTAAIVVARFDFFPSTFLPFFSPYTIFYSLREKEEQFVAGNARVARTPHMQSVLRL